MNYRHAFHAGNFADLVKHATLLQILRRMIQDPAPLTMIDTHAGRGIYDLAGEEAQRSGEAAAGVLRLMSAKAAPAVFEPLAQAVRALNGSGETRRYPGSPWLIAQILRRDDRYMACELRREEHAALQRALAGRPGVQTLCADGYDTAVQRCPASGPVLLLVDPPFERADDYARTVETVSRVRRRNRGARALIWLPLKDLETFDAFLRDLEDAVAEPILVAETRMRPLTDPMKMNGCALVLVDAPTGLDGELETICGWVAETLGEGGAARVYGL